MVPSPKVRFRGAPDDLRRSNFQHRYNRHRQTARRDQQRYPFLQRHSLRRAHERGQPLHARTAAGTWTGVRDATAYGPIAPQLSRDGTGGGNPIDDARGSEGEDCLVLNVFTPGIGDGGKRPVMLWCHGGGYITGSGGAAYDGSNLARRGDVVVVTINHRLNGLGFLHLGDIGGPEFGQSGNVGMLDIVTALDWVRDNISAFGGDSGNVTVFGESGGGRKVAVLMAMPSAKGLFHRAIIQSGPDLRGNERAYATELAEAVMAELGLKPSQLRELQQVPLERFMAALSAASAKMPSSNARGGFRPVVDGTVLPSHPWADGAPSISADVHSVGFNRTMSTLFCNARNRSNLTTQASRARGRLLRDRADGSSNGFWRSIRCQPSDLTRRPHGLPAHPSTRSESRSVSRSRRAPSYATPRMGIPGALGHAQDSACARNPVRVR